MGFLRNKQTHHLQKLKFSNFLQLLLLPSNYVSFYLFIVDSCDPIVVDNVRMRKTLGIVRVAEDGKKFYKPDVSDDVKPLKGRLFNTLEDGIQFYKTYAKLSGFEVRKSTQYNTKDGKLRQKYIVCSREGFKPIAPMDTLVDKMDKQEIKKPKEKRKRPSCRCGCLAKCIFESTNENKYVVYEFDEEHNHPFVDEDDIPVLKSSRKLTFSKKQLLFRVSNNNIGPMKAFKMMKELFGGFDEIGATSVDCEFDAEMVVELLMNKQEYIPGFHAIISPMGMVLLRVCFGRMKLQRIITFVSVTSSHLTQHFALTNNHHRSVTFAAALLSKETWESYAWLLRAFKKAFGSEPKVVVTDQDPAMKIAIEKEFSNSRHRLCMWHIMEKLSTKVGPELCKDETFKRRICNIVWTDTIEPSEFEREWDSIITDFELQSNNWLTDMFALRFNWIPAYYRDESLSGLMRTTSWSESENHFFGQLTSTTLTLVEFVSHFETAMDVQRYTHRTNQHKTRYTTPDLLTDYVLEKQAHEICASITECMSMSVMAIDGTHKFFIKEIGPVVSSKGLFEVLFTPSDATLSCSCKRFERCGLMCRHSFYVLRICGVTEFPQKYVLKRWTRDAVTPVKRVVFDARNKLSDGSVRDELVKEIIGSFEYCADKLASSIKELSIFRDRLQDLKSKIDAELPNQRPMTDHEVISSALGVSKPSKVRVRNPLQCRRKGDRTNSRIIPPKERAMTDGAKKPRQCKKCGEQDADHDSRNCTKFQLKKRNMPDA
ncbi:FAR1 DNA binding domain, Zinc finger, SWIM-type, MULE transposase domain, FHY3/FAR1 family [Artemisia annua]|uniref:FAR1 DNA binding domain, Zinc finger, SWIM-type, MULE transposase domain, FHY3/FAR1 family n=1 Tax=Artemisia annua TaxID=35608 RepID=A0A2U1NDS2_ARTAN|nr:FAR1 DNA binding domain, Zinc finger, SWIM-type, MULE transposase domain, FHY3/FAR1 family [Artemisia annua]